MRVIICDDEEKVCQLIHDLIDWDALGIEQVKSAHSGFETIELTQSFHPDLIISDVRMPGCPGSELVRIIRKISPDTDFIMISGYHYAEYPQSILDFDIVDYLLKPIDREELYSAVKKAKARYLARTGGAPVHPDASSLPSGARSICCPGLFTDFLSSAAARAVSETELDLRYSLRLQEGCYLPAIFRLCSRNYDHMGKALSLLEQRLDMLLTRFLPQEVFSCYHTEDLCLYLLLNFPAPLQTAVRRSLRNLQYELCCSILVFPETVLTPTIGPLAASLSALRGAWSATQQLSLQSLIPSQSGVSETGVAPLTRLSVLPCWTAFQQELYAAASALDPERVRECFQTLRRSIQPVCGTLDGRDCWLSLHHIVQSFWYRLSLHGGTFPDFDAFAEQYARILRCCATLDELLQAAEDFFRSAITNVENDRQTGRFHELEQVRAFIEHHYAERLTLQQLQQATGIGDLDALFAGEMQRSFEDYLTEVRITHAKQLLRDASIPLRLIPALTGYSDFTAFKRAFIRLNGLHPRVFRKLYRKD